MIKTVILLMLGCSAVAIGVALSHFALVPYCDTHSIQDYRVLVQQHTIPLLGMASIAGLTAFLSFKNI